MLNRFALANWALLYIPALLLAGIGISFAETRFDYGVLHEGFNSSRLSFRYALIVGFCILPAVAWPVLIATTSRRLLRKPRRENSDGIAKNVSIGTNHDR